MAFYGARDPDSVLASAKRSQVSCQEPGCQGRGGASGDFSHSFVGKGAREKGSGLLEILRSVDIAVAITSETLPACIAVGSCASCTVKIRTQARLGILDVIISLACELCFVVSDLGFLQDP